MAVKEQVTRKYTGQHGEDGRPLYNVTRHGQARLPESVAEWREQRLGALAPVAGRPAGKVVVKLIMADTDAETRAALAEGKDLNEFDRHGVLKTLEVIRQRGRECPPATELAERLYREWTAKYGDKQPRPRRGAA